MEPCAAQCTAVLLDRLTEFAKSEQSFNLQHWMQFYAFDVIGLITVNKRFGFLDSGKDQNLLISSLHSYLVYAAHVGIYHALHPFLSKILGLLPAGGIAHLGEFTLQQISDARKTMTEKSSSSDSSNSFLKKLLDMQGKNPDKISNADIFTTCITNIGAGSDTTSISLTAILYHICKHPNVYQKLREEINRSEAEGKLSSDEITFQQSQALPYLQACIKEALRLHPARGCLSLALSPKAVLNSAVDSFLKEIVGVNAWVAHRNRAVFRDDADSYRPERWIENPARTSTMDRYFMAFGGGARTCIGKNISLMEIGKLIPQLIRHFDFELVDPMAEVKTQNVWFVKQLDIIQCRVRLRNM